MPESIDEMLFLVYLPFATADALDLNLARAKLAHLNNIGASGADLRRYERAVKAMEKRLLLRAVAFARAA